ATTGKTINRSLECIKYYGGNTVGISAIFSAIDKKYDIEIDSIFTPDDIGGYETYPFTECPLCKEGRRIDAIVNSFGYSKI
ncbi:MAG: orotate phosphoribosyltransferase, partial [Oscillospiraceae bacterium]